MIVTRPYPDTKDVWAFGLAISKWWFSELIIFPKGMWIVLAWLLLASPITLQAIGLSKISAVCIYEFGIIVLSIITITLGSIKSIRKIKTK